jgi:hypothetical protein
MNGSLKEARHKTVRPDNCLNCHIPLSVPKRFGPVPEGTRRHAARGLCNRCYDHDFKASRKPEKPAPTPHAKSLTPEQLAYYRAGLTHYFQRRRQRIQRQARLALIQKAAS